MEPPEPPSLRMRWWLVLPVRLTLAIAVVVISYALLETVPYHPTWEWTPLGGGVVLGANPHTLWFVPITIACTLLMPHVSYRHRDTNAAVTTER